jgi:hypothetical protein
MEDFELVVQGGTEVIEEANSETNTMAQQQLTANFDYLKSSFDDNLNRVVNRMQSSNENFDAKINTLNQHVLSMKCNLEALRIDIGALKKIQEDEKKQKTLSRALNMTELNSFSYMVKRDDDIYCMDTYDSSMLAVSAIKWFMTDHGYILSSSMIIEDESFRCDASPYSMKSSAEKERMNKEFVDRFAAQIKILIQREPRLVKKDNGWLICYE